MPMPDFVGWNQEQQASDQRALGNLSSLTNVQMARQKMQQDQTLLPLKADYMKAQAEQARAHVENFRMQQQKQQMLMQLMPTIQDSPDSMIGIGTALNIPALVNQGKWLKKQKAEAGGLASLQSQPNPSMAESINRGPEGAPLQPSDIPTNEWGAYQQAMKSPPGQPINIPGSQIPTFGGALRPQMESPNPGIAQQASQVQGQINGLQPGGMPLTSVEGMVNRVTGAEQSLSNRPQQRPESPVAIIGADGKARYVPASQAYGETPASAQNRGDVVEPENADLHGDAYIATLPPGMRNVVRGLISYQLPLNQLSVRSGERQAAFAHAAQADPNFNVAKYQQRQKVMNDFTSGKVADNLTALGQAINHMNTMSELSNALKNGNVQVVNQAVNFARRQLGDPAITNYETAQSAVGTELMRVFRQVQASEVETKDWISKFPTKGSPEQIKGSLATGAKLLKGRMDELNHRWNKGMDTDTGYPGLMSPAVQESFNKLLGNISTGAPMGAVEYNGYRFPNQAALDAYKKASGQ